MSNPVVHFEVSGADPTRLRQYYSRLFRWEFDTDSPVAPSISEAGDYGFLTPRDGITGGVGGGRGYPNHSVFYVGVEDVADALAEAERLGGSRVLGPEANPSGALVIAQFRDPEGNLIGLAGPDLTREPRSTDSGDRPGGDRNPHRDGFLHIILG